MGGIVIAVVRAICIINVESNGYNKCTRSVELAINCDAKGPTFTRTSWEMRPMPFPVDPNSGNCHNQIGDVTPRMSFESSFD